MEERAVAVELFRQASARLQKGQFAVAARLSERAREVFQAAGDADGACAASSLLGRVRVREGRLDEAHACFTWAREEAARRGLEGRELAAWTELGALHELAGQLPQAVAVHRQVLERQRLRQDSLGIAIAAGNVGRLLPRLAPRPQDTEALQDDARALLTEARERFEAGGSVPGVANSWICLGDLERAAGRLHAAQQAFEQVVRQTVDVQPALHAVALLNLGHVQRDRGHLPDALEGFQTSAQVAQGIGDRQGVARARLALAMAGADVRSLTETEAEFLRVEADFRSLGQPAGELTARVNRATILCRLGRLPQGREVLQGARTQLLGQGDRMAALEVTLALADVALSQGRLQEVADLLEGVPVEVCPPRLLLRRKLLDLRQHLRALDLASARAVLESVDVPSLSEPERLAVDLHQAELWTLQGKADARQLLLTWEERPTLAPRDRAAVLAARAADAFWRGPLAEAEECTERAARHWQERGEPLAQASVALLAARVVLVQGRPVDRDTLQKARDVANEAEAGDLALGVDLVLAVADGEAARALQCAQALNSRGHQMAALVGTLLAAQVLHDPECTRHAAHLLGQTQGVAPGWWNADGKPRL